MLAAILLNLPRGGSGPDGAEEDRRYYALLRARRQARHDRRIRETDAAKREEIARQAFAVVKAAKPDIAEQIVAPHVVRRPDSPRYEVDWPALILNLVTYQCLCIAQQEVEDEEILVLLLAD